METRKIFEEAGKIENEIDRLREKMYDAGTEIEDADFQYYISLMQELDNRQKET